MHQNPISVPPDLLAGFEGPTSEGKGTGAEGSVVESKKILKIDPVYLLIGIARLVCGTGSVKRYCVRPSVPAWAHSSKPAAAGLLLCACW